MSTMEYLSIDEAIESDGLRLVLTQGMPGPWAEAAKAMLNYKNIAFKPVAQLAGEANEALQAWTGQTTAPVAIYNDEPVRYTWLDILMLAERLGPDKPLLAPELETRALQLGLCREIAGENGLGWNRRLLMLAPAMRSETPPESTARMAGKYGWTEEACEGAAKAMCNCLDYFADRLTRQEEAGSDYLVGDVFSAVDLLLANFMGMFKPLPPEQNPMPEFLRRLYSEVVAEVEPSMHSQLFKHRDRMYELHLQTPLQF